MLLFSWHRAPPCIKMYPLPMWLLMNGMLMEIEIPPLSCFFWNDIGPCTLSQEASFLSWNVSKNYLLSTSIFPWMKVQMQCKVCQVDYVFLEADPCYRVFFIESRKVIRYKILKISLFHAIFWLKIEVTMGHLISDHFELHF